MTNFVDMFLLCRQNFANHNGNLRKCLNGGVKVFLFFSYISKEVKSGLDGWLKHSKCWQLLTFLKVSHKRAGKPVLVPFRRLRLSRAHTMKY